MTDKTRRMREGRANELFDALVETHGADFSGLADLAKRLDISPKKVQFQYARRRDGKRITAELLGQMLGLVEKMQAFEVEFDDPVLLEDLSALRKRDREEMETVLRDDYRRRNQALDESEAELDQREADLKKDLGSFITV